MVDLLAGIVDVFAERALEGNPLAVVDGADDLSDDQMRRIAGEFNQAETTFILHSDRADRRLRSFTANGTEVYGAGHNALGAWLWLGVRDELGAIDVARTFSQEIGEEVLAVEVVLEEGRVHARMRQAALRLAEPLADLTELAKALGLRRDDLRTDPPARPADTGAAHLMVRATDRAAVDRAVPDPSALLAVLATTTAEGCYLYALPPEADGTAYARFFNPTVGLWEDSATGTAAGPLAAYLGHEGLLPADSLAVEQGTAMGRRSILRVRLTPQPELSGTGRIVLVGTLSI